MCPPWGTSGKTTFMSTREGWKNVEDGRGARVGRVAGPDGRRTESPRWGPRRSWTTSAPTSSRVGTLSSSSLKGGGSEGTGETEGSGPLVVTLTREAGRVVGPKGVALRRLPRREVQKEEPETVSPPPSLVVVPGTPVSMSLTPRKTQSRTRDVWGRPGSIKTPTPWMSLAPRSPMGPQRVPFTCLGPLQPQSVSSVDPRPSVPTRIPSPFPWSTLSSRTQSVFGRHWEKTGASEEVREDLCCTSRGCCWPHRVGEAGAAGESSEAVEGEGAAEEEGWTAGKENQ